MAPQSVGSSPAGKAARSEAALILVGTSFRSADIAFRERAARRLPDMEGAKWGAGEAPEELAVLDTCNRLEFYLVSNDAEQAVSRLLARLGYRVPPAGRFYVNRGVDAIRHLFRVAAGLDSPVTGEDQILGQVRAAGRAAKRSGLAGPILSFLFDVAYSSGRRARRSYRVPPVNRSLSAFALRRALEELGRQPRGVLLIGSGETARLAAREAGKSPVYLLSGRRDAERAFPGVKRVSRRELRAVLTDCDLVVAATRHDGYVLTPDDLPAGQAITVLDLGFPRNVDPALKASPSVRLYNLDDVGGWTESAHPEGMAAAEESVEAEVQRFDASLTATRLSPTLAKIYRWADGIRDEETAAALRKLPDLSPHQRAVVLAMAKRLTGKLMSPHASFVKELGKGAGQKERLLLLESIFGEEGA